MTKSSAAMLRGEPVIHATRAPAVGFIPAIAAISYPFLLKAFHLVVGPPGTPASPMSVAAAAFVLALIFLVPGAGVFFATRKASGPGARRLAYACVAAPTFYVFLGVLQSMAGSVVADELVWCALWCRGALIVWWQSRVPAASVSVPSVARCRVAHGISGAVVLLYVGFHITNHLFGLMGPQAHAAVMDMGRRVYRQRLVEPLLVAAMLFQIGSGLYLAWRWSAPALNVLKTFQVASGFYLSVFILGHMNSVFIYARTYLRIPTGWAFATGAPTGLIHDAWNIRLLPHYWLGVFFVLTHLASGFRAVLIAHGLDRKSADRIWAVCAGISTCVAVAILVGMCGGRIQDF